MTTNPDMSESSLAANPADVQDQQRPVVEQGLDPEAAAETARPDGADVEADTADREEQAAEVVENDD